MGLLSKLKKQEIFKYKDSDIVAIADGKMIPPEQIHDSVFASEMMGRTVGFQIEKGDIVSPVNGTVEVVFPTGHAFAVRMKDGTGVLVHIGINTVTLNGKGFKSMVNVGEDVKAGQICTKVDINVIEANGLDTTTMLIITEPAKNHTEQHFIPYGKVTKGQKISI